MAASSHSSAIRNYALYGEPGDLPDLLHHEAIAARAVLHDWNIGPHRHPNLHQVFVLLERKGVATIDGRQRPIQSPLILNIPAGTVHGFSFERGMGGHVVTMPGELVDEVRRGRSETIGHFFEAEPTASLIAIMEALRDEHRELKLERAAMLTHWAGLLLGEVARIGRSAALGRSAAAAPVDHRLQAFDALVEAHFRERWRVSDYAAALSMTPTHLNRLVRQARASSASAEAEARSIREAKRLLAYTVLSIAEIGLQLGFADPAHFSRRFKSVAGLSPIAYRSRLGG